MRRSGSPSMLLAGIVAVVLLACGLARGQEEEGTSRKNSFALRPRAGGLFLVDGKLKKHGFDNAVQGEIGFKGTFNHLGFEVSLTGATAEETQDFGPDEKNRKLHLGGLKLTATYEFNPLAGLKKHGGEPNVYLGGGLGFYPYTETIDIDYSDPALGKVRAEEQDGIGWGLHFVAGVEYFFVEHVGLFGEVQYSYMDFDRQHRRNANLYGFSVMGGLSIKF